MILAYIWVGMVGFSLLYALFAGTAAAVGAAALSGAGRAVTLLLGMAGPLLLWSGLIEVMERSGTAAALSRILRPVLKRLFPSAERDAALMDALSCNVSANLLGLGNAATPAGLQAAGYLRRAGNSDELCRLVILNSASLQLLPTTVAAVRAGLGAANAFDILPAVWLSSAVSVCVGLLAGKILSRWF